MTRSFTVFTGEERAVSEVIGVILMVAIVVILAAVIGAFVLGIGDEVGEAAPQLSVRVNSIDADADEITFRHGGGDSLEALDTELKVEGPGPTFTLVATTAATLEPAEKFTLATNSASHVTGWAGSWDEAGGSDVTWGFATGDTVTVTFVDTPSNQIISEKVIRV